MPFFIALFSDLSHCFVICYDEHNVLLNLNVWNDFSHNSHEAEGVDMGGWRPPTPLRKVFHKFRPLEILTTYNIYTNWAKLLELGETCAWSISPNRIKVFCRPLIEKSELRDWGQSLKSRTIRACPMVYIIIDKITSAF